MLTNTNKGHGLIQSLAGGLQGVTLTIANPIVSINGATPRQLLSTLAVPEPPHVTISVRNGAVITCDDEQTAAHLQAASVTVLGGTLTGSSDDNFVQELIDAYSLDHAKAHKQRLVALHAKALRDAAVRSISAAEMAAWPLKLAEASAFSASSDPAHAPMLQAEASARQITLPQLVGKVDGKATAFAGLEAAISGIDGLHRDAIEALTTFQDIAAYDYFAGWPPVDLT